MPLVLRGVPATPTPAAPAPFSGRAAPVGLLRRVALRRERPSGRARSVSSATFPQGARRGPAPATCLRSGLGPAVKERGGEACPE